jgi:hypothetical protein
MLLGEAESREVEDDWRRAPRGRRASRAGRWAARIARRAPSRADPPQSA